MLFLPPPLSPRETGVLARIEELKATLSYAVSTAPRRWYGLLRRSTFARAIRGSNSIEGYNVSVDDAIAAAEGEAPLEADEAVWLEIVGYRTAMTYVLQLAGDPHFRYSTDLIRSLHFMMLQHDLRKHPGRWRPGPIVVHDQERDEIVYEAPDASLVPPLMDELIASLTAADGQPDLVRAAMAHLNLVMIHPFADGNGRMARCLQSLVLARTGALAAPFSSIEEYLGHNTRAYYDVLAEVGGGAWQPERDAGPWIRFCLTAHFRQATTLLRRTREMGRLWELLEGEAGKRRLPERMILALADAALGHRVRNATYRSAADVSEHAAGRDLKILVDQGLLLSEGEKRGRFYLAAPFLRELREKVREAGKMEDPFADPSPE
jgi:Fic family protein